MTLHRSLAFTLSAALLANALSPALVAQPAAQPGPSLPAATPVKEPPTPPLTEEALRTRLMGKLLFVRGFYMGDDLQFDMDGKVSGSPATSSFTLSALEVKKIKLSKRKLEIEADRYGLHFFGALPNEDESKPYDKVRISKKPIRISIDRELVVIPKVKKDKSKEKNDARLLAGAKPSAAAPAGAKAGVTQNPPAAASTTTATGAPAASSSATEVAEGDSEQSAPAQAATAAAAPVSASASASAPAGPAAASAGTAPAMPLSIQPGTTTSPAHSARLLNAAIDKVFATEVDKDFLAQLPGYWQQYYASRSQHRELLPGDGRIPVLGAGMTPPRVLNSIDPSSNEYAQKYGIAGLTLFRTVVDASGNPQQISIARPIGFGLDETAIDAIRKSHFTPAMQDGHPTPVVIDLVVTFRIYSNRTKPGSVPRGSKPTVLAASAAGSDVAKKH